MTETDKRWESYLEKIDAAATAAEVDALDLELFGRKQGVMMMALKELGTATPEERKTKGQELNVWKMRLGEALADRRGALMHASFSKLGESDQLDATLELPKKEHGHLHLIPEFIRTIEDVFGRMGFDVAEGPEVETEENNFTLLNFQKDHAAMDMQATYWVEGDERKLLRTQTSPVQIHYMRSHKPPFRMICPGKVYRKDYDATHSPMFHQFEGLMIGEDVSLANMKGVMIAAMKELISPDIEFRFRTSYFPFVEPGLEVDMRWHAHGKEGPGRWLEVVGCGMVHENVLKNAGIDSKKWRGFAFGFGVERLIMIKHGIRDLRSFYEGDLRFLRQF